MRILVTGSAGFIGSAVCWKLHEAGHEVEGLDSFRYGHPRTAKYGECEWLPCSRKSHWYDLASQKLTAFFEWGQFDAVAHLAGESEIIRSFKNPVSAYAPNVIGGLRLLNSMRTAGIKKFVFASTSSVYSLDSEIPIDEDAPLGPTTPYGASKLAFEDALRWYPQITSTVFRFFNVCGSTEHVYERPYHRNRLMCLAMDHASGARPGAFTMNGRDYKTADGTCVRDYIHVDDVASAFVRAIEREAPGNEVFNLGIGFGYSNQQVIDAVGQVVGMTVPVVDGPRREGDPPILIADSRKAQKVLGWKPEFTDLMSIVETAWRWKP